MSLHYNFLESRVLRLFKKSLKENVPFDELLIDLNAQEREESVKEEDLRHTMKLLYLEGLFSCHGSYSETNGYSITREGLLVVREMDS